MAPRRPKCWLWMNIALWRYLMASSVLANWAAAGRRDGGAGRSQRERGKAIHRGLFLVGSAAGTGAAGQFRDSVATLCIETTRRRSGSDFANLRLPPLRPPPSSMTDTFQPTTRRASWAARGATRTRVWDLPTRLFHWALAAAVIGQLVTGLAGIMEWHFRVGYAVLSLLLFRLVWGFVGGRWSRFAAFIYSPGSVMAYLRGRGASGPPDRPHAAGRVVGVRGARDPGAAGGDRPGGRRRDRRVGPADALRLRRHGEPGDAAGTQAQGKWIVIALVEPACAGGAVSTCWSSATGWCGR